VLKKYNQSLTESSNSNKPIHDSFDFQEVSVKEKFKIYDEKLGIQGFTYHQQMQSFFLDKDNKEEQFSQTTSSEIFNNHDQKDDFVVGYDQSIEEKVVFQKHLATIITYQEDIIKDIFVSNSSKELAVHEEHEQFKESVFGRSLELKLFQDNDEDCVYACNDQRMLSYIFQDPVVDWIKYFSFQS